MSLEASSVASGIESFRAWSHSSVPRTRLAPSSVDDLLGWVTGIDRFNEHRA
jgi:hypothetical protein